MAHSWTFWSQLRENSPSQPAAEPTGSFTVEIHQASTASLCSLRKLDWRGSKIGSGQSSLAKKRSSLPLEVASASSGLQNASAAAAAAAATTKTPPKTPLSRSETHKIELEYLPRRRFETSFNSKWSEVFQLTTCPARLINDLRLTSTKLKIEFTFPNFTHLHTPPHAQQWHWFLNPMTSQWGLFLFFTHCPSRICMDRRFVETEQMRRKQIGGKNVWTFSWRGQVRCFWDERNNNVQV